MTWRKAYATCVALVVLVHCRLVWPGNALVANDFRALFIPLRAGLKATIAAHEWPWWQRGIFVGYPILGDIQFQLFNPLTWLTLPLDPARGITLQSVAELCICAVGMAFWMKQRGLEPWHGVFAACVFALGLKETVHLHHWTFASSTAAWPWILAGIDGELIWLTAVATCGTWFGASPQMAYFGTALALLYALTTRSWRQAGAVVLGVALAAPLLLPVAELSALGPRGPGVTYRFQSQWSWPGREIWVGLLLPRAWGGRPHYAGPMNYWEVQGYVGLLPMALLAAAPWKKRGVILFAVIAVLCVWFSFGSESWLHFHRAMTYLPGYGGFRNPTRAMMLAAFCVAVLSAEALAEIGVSIRISRYPLVALGVLALLVCVCMLRGYSGVVALAILAVAALWSWRKPEWAAVACALFLADVTYQTYDSPEIGVAAEEGQALEGLSEYIPKAPAPRRVLTLLEWGEDNNATFARGWEGVTGYGPTPILRVLDLMYATYLGAPPPPRPLNDDPNFPRVRTDSPLTPLFGAQFVATNRDANFAPLAKQGEVRLYTMPALPRVYWTNKRVQGDAIDVSGGVPALDEPEVRNNSVKANVQAPADGLAVFLEPWFPGWTAYVDGVPAELTRANYAFLAVPVTKGVHNVEIRYFPTRLLPGLAFALLALVLTGILASHRVDRPDHHVY